MHLGVVRKTNPGLNPVAVKRNSGRHRCSIGKPMQAGERSTPLIIWRWIVVCRRASYGVNPGGLWHTGLMTDQNQRCHIEVVSVTLSPSSANALPMVGLCACGDPSSLDIRMAVLIGSLCRTRQIREHRDRFVEWSILSSTKG